MRRFLNKQIIANIALWVMVIGGLVMTLGIGSCLYIARQELYRETDQNMETSVAYLQMYIDGQLHHVEDICYAMLGNIKRNTQGEKVVAIDKDYVSSITQDNVYLWMEQILDAEPSICGIAIVMERTYSMIDNYFTDYISNLSGKTERYNLADFCNVYEQEWYVQAASQRKAYWSHPFRDPASDNPVACLALPLFDEDTIVGVVAVYVDVVGFRENCMEQAPFPEMNVSVLDADSVLVSYPDTAMILHHVKEVENFANTDLDIVVTAPIERANWTIVIESPKNLVFERINKMRHRTSLIAAGCIIFMFICLIWLFRKMQEFTLKKADVDSQLSIAAKIQIGMLPHDYPAFPDRKELDIFAYVQPAKEVGGDYYDYVIRDEKCYFCVGDVSGKGVPASLFMAILHALFRHLSQFYSDPALMMEALNNTLASNNSRNMFCTIFIGIMDLQTGRVDYCNAGHNAPVIRRKTDDGKINVSFADVKVNIALGVLENMKFEKETIVLNPNEALLLYTDGIVEAENNQKKIFGDEALLSKIYQIWKSGSKNAKEVSESVLNAVQLFTDGAQQSDDITLLVVQYTGQASQLRLTNDIHQIPQLGEWVKQVGTNFGLGQDRILQLNLALEECVVNVMEYAYGEQKNMPVLISASKEENHMIFTIRDKGVPFDPTKTENPDISLSIQDREIGGLGIFMTKQLTDKLEYRRENDQNILELTFLM